jgi:hypothetical protein
LFYFLALSSSKDNTIVCLVDGIIVNKEVDEEVNEEVDKEVDEEVDKEVDNRTVGRGIFERVLLAEKSVIGLNKLCRPLRTLIASNL